MNNPIKALRAVLCDPEGNVCIHGSAADRQIIFDALARLDAPTSLSLTDGQIESYSCKTSSRHRRCEEA